MIFILWNLEFCWYKNQFKRVALLQFWWLFLIPLCIGMLGFLLYHLMFRVHSGKLVTISAHVISLWQSLPSPEKKNNFMKSLSIDKNWCRGHCIQMIYFKEIFKDKRMIEKFKNRDKKYSFVVFLSYEIFFMHTYVSWIEL